MVLSWKFEIFADLVFLTLIFLTISFIKLLSIFRAGIFTVYNMYFYIVNLLEKVEVGVPLDEVKAFQKKYMFTHKQMAYLMAMSEKGYYNLLNKNNSLSRIQSGQFLKVAEVFREGEEALTSKEAFLEWLQQPHWYFNHKKPFDLLDTPIGADAIIEELGRAKYGMLS